MAMTVSFSISSEIFNANTNIRYYTLTLGTYTSTYYRENRVTAFI